MLAKILNLFLPLKAFVASRALRGANRNDVLPSNSGNAAYDLRYGRRRSDADNADSRRWDASRIIIFAIA